MLAVCLLASSPSNGRLFLADHPILIAHRGASGERPEHTIASYTLAIEQGADFIEPDLVLTKDGILVARHENEISTTTDVADHPEFASRKATKVIDGHSVKGWFTEDFTLAELKMLRAKERLPKLRPANTAYDGQFTIPTFDEIIALAQAKSKETGRRIGLYPETKHPSYFASIGLPHEGPLLAALEGAGYTRKDDPVFIQSFEVGNLIALSSRTSLRLIQLVDADGGPADRPETTYAEILADEGLKSVARYAAGIGPAKDLIIRRTLLGALDGSTGLVPRCHAAGLEVHPWTFRAENFFLPLGLRNGINPRSTGDLAEEIRLFLAEGIDGLFCDFPGIARAVIDKSR
ncbi:MAG: glycerophosphodiester phosphodiesterase [Sphingomonadales bacterium]|nr:glycerophosphodiester phosphodiesterase [Sphingomonadales bacterium]